MKLLAITYFAALHASSAAADPPSQPHLAQAWTAMSTGDGEPNQTGKESYIYCPSKKTSDDCIQAHVWDYGADTCQKFEVNRGYGSKWSGTYLVKCDAVNCCTEDDTQGELPDIKMWDIGMGKSIITHDTVTYGGNVQTQELYNKTVQADLWEETFNLPFTKEKVTYNYYVSGQGSDIITHRIDYGVTNTTAGTILYGDFKVIHNLTDFASVFEPPQECLKPNVLKCPSSHVKKVYKKYFKHEAAIRGYFD